MNNFIKIIRTLRKSTLEDIGKKAGLNGNDLVKDELVEAIEELIVQPDRKRNFFDTALFKIGFPILMALFGFFIGRVTDISNTEVNANLAKVDTTTQKTIRKLSQPLPNNLEIKSLNIQVDTSVFAAFLPEVRNLYTSSGKIIAYEDEDFKDTLKRGIQFYNGRYSNELRSIFDGKNLDITLVIGSNIFEENEELHQPYLIWKYDTKVWLRNNNQYLHYWIDHLNPNKEYLELSYYNEEKDIYLKQSKIKYMNGVGSAMDFCDKKVRISMAIRENSEHGINPPQLSFRNFSFTDNNNKEYEIEFVKHSDYYSKELLKSVRKHYPDYNLENLKWYMEGVFKCKSF